MGWYLPQNPLPRLRRKGVAAAVTKFFKMPQRYQWYRVEAATKKTIFAKCHAS